MGQRDSSFKRHSMRENSGCNSASWTKKILDLPLRVSPNVFRRVYTQASPSTPALKDPIFLKKIVLIFFA